jgi:hypothetical protein
MITQERDMITQERDMIRYRLWKRGEIYDKRGERDMIRERREM